MGALLPWQDYHSGHPLPTGSQANSQKRLAIHDLVHMLLQNRNQDPSYSLPSPVSFPPFSIHPLLYPMDPSQKILHLIHPPPVHPAPRTSIFPAPTAGRLVPPPTDDQPSIHLHPQNLPHPTSHIPFVVLPHSYLIMALKRVPHRHHQTSRPYPYLLPPFRTRTCSLK